MPPRKWILFGGGAVDAEVVVEKAASFSDESVSAGLCAMWSALLHAGADTSWEPYLTWWIPCIHARL